VQFGAASAQLYTHRPVAQDRICVRASGVLVNGAIRLFVLFSALSYQLAEPGPTSVFLEVSGVKSHLMDSFIKRPV
jgi:hypothetical protein